MAKSELHAKQYVLAIDLGTGGPKVAILSASGEIAAVASRAIDTIFIAGGGAEQNPAQWWTAITSATREVMETAGIDPGDVAAIGCTAQWSGTVAVDKAGAPLRSAIIWMDSRGAKDIERQIGGFPEIMGYRASRILNWVRLAGGAPGRSGKDPIAHVLWIKNHEPALYDAAYKFLEPVDWIGMKLTGLASASYDSICLHWVTDNRDIRNVKYSKRLLDIAGIDPAKLPDLVATGSILGNLNNEAASEMGLPAGIPVVAGSGDVHSAVVGSGAVEDFDVHLYIGTSSWISCHVPFKKTSALRNIASIPSAIPGRYLVADEHETAGACLDFAISTLFAGIKGSETGNVAGNAVADNAAGADNATAGGSNPNNTQGNGSATATRERDARASGVRAPTYSRTEERTPSALYTAMEQAASAAPPGSGGVIFTPWLNGERSPVDDHTLRAGLHNLSLSTTQNELIRSIYEGVAFNSKWLLGAVESFTGRRCKSLAFIGGGAQSALWARIHADVLQRDIVPVNEPILANVRGAGLLAWLAIGRIQAGDIHGMVATGTRVKPDPDLAPIYESGYKSYVEIYKKTHGIYRRLNA
jgi:xylulokinase